MNYLSNDYVVFPDGILAHWLIDIDTNDNL